MVMESTATLLPETVKPYQAALDGDWERMKRFYEKSEDQQMVCHPLTVTNDNALLIAVYSGKTEPLESLLRINGRAINSKNKHGNNALHEAAAIGNIEAAKLLVSRNKGLLVAKNLLGETPLFRAAAFGSIEVVKFLASEVEEEQRNEQILCTTKESSRTLTSILHVAIQGEHFETALWLLNNFIGENNIGKLRDSFEFSCLEVLSRMPNSFKSGYPMNAFKGFLYSCLPCVDCDDEFRGKEDLESGGEKNKHSQSRCSHVRTHTVSSMYRSLWFCLAKAFPNINEIWKQKRKHEFAFKVARMLIHEDKSWQHSHAKPDVRTICLGRCERRITSNTGESEASVTPSPITSKTGESAASLASSSITSDTGESEASVSPLPKTSNTGDSTASPTPLLIATSTGIKEIVIEILSEFPQAVEHVSSMGQSVLHMAIKHRQLDIYRLVRNMRMPMTRLVWKIDDDKENTILHHAACMDFYRGNQPNPALQLQDELCWFERVQKITPPQYAMHHNKDNFTPEELFKKSHEKLHEEAQNWLKRTSESCSVIAVLIATVVFAAAYTLPGGSDSKTGNAKLSGQTFFTVFTVMDVVALVTSLTAVVMFMSIITSPFRLGDFQQTLPGKLTLGLTFLFFSVVTTMLAFAATVVIFIHLKRQWLTTLVYTVAFVPVTVFALFQFPLYMSFISTLKYSLQVIKRSLPWCIVRCFSRTSNAFRYT